MCMIAVQGNMKQSCMWFLDIKGGFGEGDAASQDKNLSEIWVLKQRV